MCNWFWLYSPVKISACMKRQLLEQLQWEWSNLAWKYRCQARNLRKLGSSPEMALQESWPALRARQRMASRLNLALIIWHTFYSSNCSRTACWAPHLLASPPELYACHLLVNPLHARNQGNAQLIEVLRIWIALSVEKKALLDIIIMLACLLRLKQ